MPDLSMLRPERERVSADLRELATYRDPDAPGWSRQLFSEPYRASREWIRRRMDAAGLDVHVDGAGNIVGRLPGRTSAEPLVTGSHTDTVRGGGRFDGTVGVLGGIEAARRLRETGRQLDHDLLVVDFLGEETNPYGFGCLGSRAATAEMSAEDLERTDDAGNRLGDAVTAFGLDTEGVLSTDWARQPLRGYLELHIEQGPALERQDVQIGVVTAIAGIERVLATFLGTADHAGTRPMGERHDALVAAARTVLAVENEGCGGPVDAVATSGRLEARPGSLNVVPDHAQVWAEFRSTDVEWLGGVRGRVAAEIARLSAESGVESFLNWVTDNPAIPTHRTVQDVTASAADQLGRSWIPVPSGATHDAAHLARLCPTGMIFVPSQEGRSHCPEEWTEVDDVCAGVHVLAASLLRLDQEDRLAGER